MAIRQIGFSKFVGLSTDTKPTLSDNDIGTEFYEYDNDQKWFWHGSTKGWDICIPKIPDYDGRTLGPENIGDIFFDTTFEKLFVWTPSGKEYIVSNL